MESKTGKLGPRSVMHHFRERVTKFVGATVESGEPDCMYWLKHQEAALLVAILDGVVQTPKLGMDAKRHMRRLLTKVAMQWVKYDRLEDHKSPPKEKP
jgi:hypothetical protein